MRKSRFSLLFLIAVVGFPHVAAMRAAHGQSRATTVSVKDFGAKGDGETDDAPAIQKAIASVPPGTTIFFPPGTYQVGVEIDVNRNDITLTGVGVESILRRTPRSRHHILSIPADKPANRSLIVENVTISRLTFDGNIFQIAGPYYRGIWVRQARNVTLTELYLHDHHYESIATGTAYLTNENITISKVHIEAGRRQGIHVGQGKNTVIDQVYVENTPAAILNPDGTPRLDARGRPAFEAGTGVDIETQGRKPYSFVDGVQVTNSIFEREPPQNASAGIAISPPYGPVKNVLVSGNVVKNHQMGVQLMGNTVKRNETWGMNNIRVENNFILNERSAVAGYGMQIIRSLDVLLSGNVITDLTRLWRAGMRVVLSDVQAERNDFRLPTCAVQVIGGGTQLTLANNRHAGPCLINEREAIGSFNQRNNSQLPASAADQSPPQVTIGATPNQTFAARATISVRASDAGSGVARVFFFIDGIPAGYSDTATASFTLDPTRYLSGRHTLSALAVNRAARLSEKVTVPIVIRNPNASSRPR